MAQHKIGGIHDCCWLGILFIAASLNRLDGQKIIAHLYGTDLKRLFCFRSLNKNKIV